MSEKFDLMYVENGGDIIQGFKHWNSSQSLLIETAKTYSGDVFTFSKENGFSTYALSSHVTADSYSENNFTVEHIPKPKSNSSLSYHLNQIKYGLKVVGLAFKKRPKQLHIVDGVTYLIMLMPLKLIGTDVHIHYHNTLWPNGFPPQKLAQKIILKLEGVYLKYFAKSAFGVSPRIVKQIQQITNSEQYPAYIYVPQFPENDFDDSILPTPHSKDYFKVVFAGRIQEDKGIFDILDMAKAFKGTNVTFDICGQGKDLELLQQTSKDMDLEKIVNIHGPLKRPELLKIYNAGHVVIVPTRSDFAEGFAKVAAEAVLLDKPIITSPVVPALDALRECALEAKTNDVNSYVIAIKKLIDNEDLYNEKVAACKHLKKQFFDGKRSLLNIMKETINN